MYQLKETSGQALLPHVALNKLHETPNWSCLQQKALEMESLVDLQIVYHPGVKEPDDIPLHFFDNK